VTDVAFRTRRRKRITVLNVTSLVDVMFLLLLFFMLTTTFHRTGDLKLNLPRSTTAEVEGEGEAQQQAELVLLADGTVLLGHDRVDPSQLESKLAALVKTQHDSRIMVKAEAAARHGDVVHLLDLVREAGFSGVSIGTEVPIGEGRK
jgi:biopolymer transport protein ExbD